MEDNKEVVIQFVHQDQRVGPQISVPLNTPKRVLEQILHNIREDENRYSYYVNGTEITQSIQENCKDSFTVKNGIVYSSEKVLEIEFREVNICKASRLTRCTSALQGHNGPVICVSFSPSGNTIISGSGDSTVKIWDSRTETALNDFKTHTNWILCLSWSHDGRYFASGAMDGCIQIWNGETSDPGSTREEPLSPCGDIIRAHKKGVTCMAWKRNDYYLATGSADGSVKIWNIVLKKTRWCLSGHSQHVTSLFWTSSNRVYSSSRDSHIKVWDPETGVLLQTLSGHSHWINSISVSTDGMKDNVVSGSDDYTVVLWKNQFSKDACVIKMLGHKAPVNHVIFSPNGQFIVSSSFDKSLKLWSRDGEFLHTFKGHVSAIFKSAWSPDSRFFLSVSKDTTTKLWSANDRKILETLPGHNDEVYDVDWSASGNKAVTCSKDKTLRILRGQT